MGGQRKKIDIRLRGTHPYPQGGWSMRVQARGLDALLNFIPDPGRVSSQSKFSVSGRATLIRLAVGILEVLEPGTKKQDLEGPGRATLLRAALGLLDAVQPPDKKGQR